MGKTTEKGLLGTSQTDLTSHISHDITRNKHLPLVGVPRTCEERDVLIFTAVGPLSS